MSTTPLTDAYIARLEAEERVKNAAQAPAPGARAAVKAATLEVLETMREGAASHKIAPLQARQIAVGALLFYIDDQEIIDAYNAIGQ